MKLAQESGEPLLGDGLAKIPFSFCVTAPPASRQRALPVSR